MRSGSSIQERSQLQALGIGAGSLNSQEKMQMVLDLLARQEQIRELSLEQTDFRNELISVQLVSTITENRTLVQVSLAGCAFRRGFLGSLLAKCKQEDKLFLSLDLSRSNLQGSADQLFELAFLYCMQTINLESLSSVSWS